MSKKFEPGQPIMYDDGEGVTFTGTFVETLDMTDVNNGEHHTFIVMEVDDHYPLRGIYKEEYINGLD